MKWEWILLLAVIALVVLAACIRRPSETEPVSTKDTETEPENEKAARLVFSSFDGGGPSYRVRIRDTAVLKYSVKYDYGEHAGEVIDGARYDVVMTFTGLKEGKTEVTVTESSPMGAFGDREYVYEAVVDNELNAVLTLRETKGNEEEDWEAIASAIKPVPTLVIEANGKIFYADPEDNASAEAFIEKLSKGSIEVKAHDYGDFEKAGDLPWKLPRNDEKITTRPGDIILYQGSQITVYYDTNTWDLTRLARIEGKDRAQMLEFLGEGEVTLVFRIEWSE